MDHITSAKEDSDSDSDSPGITQLSAPPSKRKPLSGPTLWDRGNSGQRQTVNPPAGSGDNVQEEITEYVVDTYHENISALPESATHGCQPIPMFSLPSYISETNEAMHRPKLVSIGPNYYEKIDELFQTMQEHKWWYVRDFMNAHDMDPKKCIRKMAEIETRARLCYSDGLPSYGSQWFIQMFLLDGCFILEFIRKHHGNIPDTFFGIERNKATILTDILLMGNQIPYFVIHELFNLATGKSSCSGGSSCQLRAQIFGLLPPQIMWRNPQTPCDEILHLLHFYYLSMVPDPCSFTVTRSNEKITIGGLQVGNVGKPIHYNGDEGKQLILPSVTELSEAGVRFRRNNQPRHLFDITFKNGVMEIPALFIHDFNCIMLANLVSFEQCSYGPKGIMTQFASLFANLIETEKDVAVLESSDVLINMIESKEETASFFNRLSKWNIVDHTDDHKLLIKNIRKYYESPWPKYRATLMRDYFSNPWAIISLIAALVLLGLSFVQTYYAVYSSIHK